MDGHAAEVWESHGLRHDLRAAAAEEVVFLAVVADEVAHVLHHAEDRDPQLLEHAHRAAGVVLGHALRRADHHGAGQREELAHGERHVARSGREVDDQVVERTPVGLQRQLLERAVGHRAAPDERLVRVHQLAQGHGLDAMHLEGKQHVAARRGARVLEAEDGGDARAVDVAVEQADLGTEAREAHRQVRAHRALAHAALAGADRDDVLHQGQRVAALARLLVGLADVGGELDLELPEGLAGLDGLGADGLVDVPADLVLHGARRRGELDHELHVVAGDMDVLHHAQGDQVLVEVGVLDRAEGVVEVLARKGHSPAIVARPGVFPGRWGVSGQGSAVSGRPPGRRAAIPPWRARYAPAGQAPAPRRFP